MKEILLRLIIIAYAANSIVGIVGYFPTMKDLYYRKIQSANASSYTVWTFTSSISFLYALFIIPDLLFRIVTGINFLSCVTVLVLSMRLRKDK